MLWFPHQKKNEDYSNCLTIRLLGLNELIRIESLAHYKCYVSACCYFWKLRSCDKTLPKLRCRHCQLSPCSPASNSWATVTIHMLQSFRGLSLALGNSQRYKDSHFVSKSLFCSLTLG